MIGFEEMKPTAPKMLKIPWNVSASIHVRVSQDGSDQRYETAIYDAKGDLVAFVPDVAIAGWICQCMNACEDMDEPRTEVAAMRVHSETLRLVVGAVADTDFESVP